MTAGESNKAPFVDLKPGERKRIWFLYLPELPPGRHRIRTTCVHAHDSWTHTRPIATDGPPVFQKVEDAGMGVVVSNQLVIAVEATTAEKRPGTR